MLWRPKNHVLKVWNRGYLRSFHTCVCMLPKNPNFECIVGPTSNGYNSLHINPNMQNLCWNWSPGCLISNITNLTQKCFFGSNVMIKIVSKSHFSASFSKQFEHFWVVIFPHYFELFSYPWLTYFKLIIGAKDQRLFTDTKWDVYSLQPHPFVPREIYVLVELILEHLHYLLANVPPQPYSTPETVLCPDLPTEASLGSQNRTKPPF